MNIGVFCVCVSLIWHLCEEISPSLDIFIHKMALQTIVIPFYGGI